MTDADVVPQSDGWADSGTREAQAHPGIHGTYHRHDVIEWWEPSSCEYTADYEHPICPVNECASGDDGHECRVICERIDIEGGSGAWRCAHHGYFRVFDYPSEVEQETEQATLLADGGPVQDTEEVEHGILGNVERGDTLRVELADEQIVAEVDETRRHEECAIVGRGVTVIEDGHQGDIYELETQYDPRDGWSPVEVTRRVYIKNETEWLDEGVAEQIVVINPGIERDRLDPGVTVEGVDGDRYRVVVPPWEREYDDKALTYNLENSVNACEKLDPSEVVRRVE